MIKMLAIIKKISLGLAAFAVSFSIGLAPALAATDCTTSATTPQAEAQCGINGGNGSVTTPDATTGLHNTISTVLDWLSIIVGVVAVIMIVVAGLRFITSGGSEKGIKSAKDTILYAIIGLVIVAIAQIMVHFVLHTASGDCAKDKHGHWTNTITGADCTPP